jgi:K+-transporting ATPase ATPase C chain
MALIRPAFVLLIVLTLITGGLYPLVTTALGQWLFQTQANGSLIREGDDVVRGSRLIGQNFTAAGYFHGRPSATADAPYNPMASGGSNLAASNPELDKEVSARCPAASGKPTGRCPCAGGTDNDIGQRSG